MMHLWEEDRPEEVYCDLCGIRRWEAASQPECLGGAKSPLVRS